MRGGRTLTAHRQVREGGEGQNRSAGRGGLSMQAHVKRKSEQSVSAHSGLRQFSKPSRSWLLEALQLWKHTWWQSGVNDPTVPTLVLVASMFANSVHSGARSVSTRPARQMALVRGMTSLRVNQLMDVATPMGGGGGGGLSAVAEPPGGGGGYAMADSQTTPSAKLAEQGLSSAYMKPWMLVSTVDTKTQRLSPAGMTSGWPSMPDQAMVPPSLGLLDQKELMPLSRAYPSILNACHRESTEGWECGDKGRGRGLGKHDIPPRSSWATRAPAGRGLDDTQWLPRQSPGLSATEKGQRQEKGPGR